MAYGYKLKFFRKRAGLKEAEAAKIIGISESSLSKYENDIKKVPISVFVKLARLYDFDVIDVLNVHDGDGLVADMPMFSLVAAHCAYAIKKEMSSEQSFGNAGSLDEYHERYMELVNEYAANPIYTLNYPGKDEINFADFSPFTDKNC